jgi:hypothetical protein
MLARAGAPIERERQTVLLYIYAPVLEDAGMIGGRNAAMTLALDSGHELDRHSFPVVSGHCPLPLPPQQA